MGFKRAALEFCVTGMKAVWRFRKPKLPRSILVLRNNDLGDVAVITPLFEALRRTHPDATIVAAVRTPVREILNSNPYLSAVVECNAPWHHHGCGARSIAAPLKYIFTSHEVRELSSYNFDVGIDVLGSPFGAMLLMRLGIPIRLGRKGYAGGYTGATASIQASTSVSVARNALEFVRLLKPDAMLADRPKPQLFLDNRERRAAGRLWESLECEGPRRRPRIVMAPGAGIAAKQWPAARFAELAAHLSGGVVGCVVGSKADMGAGRTIANAARDWTDLCGQTSLRESMAIIAEADLVICHGSFAMHAAPAFNVRSIVILTSVHKLDEHATLWEIPGLHFSVKPSAGEQYPEVAAVEEQVQVILNQVEPAKAWPER